MSNIIINISLSLFLFFSCNGLLEICNEKRFEVALGTIMKDPFRSDVFDFALSIAVIHHLRTPARRLQAIEEMLRVMRNGALGLIFVWAFEENKSVRRHKLTVLDGNEQDVLVPWSMCEFPGAKKDAIEPGKRIKLSTEETQKNEESHSITTNTTNTNANTTTADSFQRYYHLFKKGELDELVEQAGGVIIESGFDRDNWYIKFQK